MKHFVSTVVNVLRNCFVIEHGERRNSSAIACSSTADRKRNVDLILTVLVKWLGLLNQGAYPETKVILTQDVFTCTCVLAISHRLYLNYLLSHGISSSICTNLRLSIDVMRHQNLKYEKSWFVRFCVLFTRIWMKP